MSLHMPETSLSAMKFPKQETTIFSPIRMPQSISNFVTPTSSRKNVRFEDQSNTHRNPFPTSNPSQTSPHSTSFNQSFTSNLGLSIKDRLDYATRFPTVQQKIEAVSNICFNELTIKDFAHNLQYLLKLIFNLDQIKTSGDTVMSQSSLCLNSLYNKKFDGSSIGASSYNDALAATEFLSPNSLLFQKLYEMQKKKIYPSIDLEMEHCLKRFYPEKFLKSGKDKDDASGAANTHNNESLHHQNPNHSTSNLAQFGKNESEAHINPSVSTTNVSSPNYVRSRENLNQITGFELYFCCFAVYGLCYDRSYEQVLEYYANQFGNSSSNSLHGHSYGQSFFARYQNSQFSSSRNDRVYYVLLQYYLNHYLPLTLDYPKLIVDKQAQHHNSPKSPSKPSTAIQSFSAIFKPNAFSKQNFEPNLQSQSSFSLKTATANSAAVIANVSYCLTLADQLVGSLCAVWFNEEFWPGRSGFMLYEEHVRDLRVIVKHVLTFVTIDTDKNLERAKSELYLPEIIHQIQNFQNSVVQQHIQPRMFRLMQNIFEFYNLPPKIMSGAYFRTIVELWLSYIQPWRYTDSGPGGYGGALKNLGSSWFGGSGGLHNTSGALGGEKNRLPEKLEDSKIWLPYIAANLDCYTILFMDILKRALRVDIGSQQEALILNRTLRVFSQNNLMELVGLAVDRPKQGQNGNINSSYFDHFPENKHLLFSEHNLSIVKALMEALQQVLATKLNFYKGQKNQKANQKTQNSSSVVDVQGWLKYFKDFLLVENAAANHENSTFPSQDKENQFLQSKLTNSLSYLSTLFNVAIPPPPTTSEDENDSASKISPKKLKEIGRRLENCRSNFNMPMAAGNYAEFNFTDNYSKVELTDHGKQELFESGGLKHAPIVINKHYDDLDCMSTEFYLLLIICRLVGNFLTSRCGAYLARVENNESGFLHDFGRHWFMTAPNEMRYSNARISVRVLAHKGFQLYFWFFYFLAKLCGYGKFQYLATVSIFWIVFMVGHFLLRGSRKSLKLD